MILYHFTSQRAAREIIADGVLKPTDPALRRKLSEETTRLVVRTDPSQPLVADAVARWSDEKIRQEFGGPLVVHCTTEHRDCASVTVGSAHESKNAARFVVEVPRSDAYPWIRWARRHSIDEDWLRALRRDVRDTQSYYVVARPIPSSQWVEVTDMGTQDALWPTG